MSTRINKVLILLLNLLLLSSCSNDDTTTIDPFVVAFETLSENVLDIDNELDIVLVYSNTTSSEGDITISISSENAIYGTEYTTSPEAVNNIITVPIANGEGSNYFTFNKLGSTLDENTDITFTIIDVNYDEAVIQGNDVFSLNSSAALGTSLQPNVGGPNEPNQVYIDLSAQSETVVKRDIWDLGFYSGDEYRVILNTSLYMAAAQLSETNINDVNSLSTEVIDLQTKVLVRSAGSDIYIDNPDGDITGTVIQEIEVTDNNNKVYLVNLGNSIGTETPSIGSEGSTGEFRGWKKIRILRDGDNYVLQYADLDDVNYKEVTISKEEGFNFNHFSLDTEKSVSVEPKKEKWDICFTVFTNVITGYGSYGYSDFVTQNTKGNTLAYEVKLETIDGEDTTDATETYNAYSLEDVVEANFSKNQTIIGSNWRNVFDRQVHIDRFYVLKDSNNNIYKIKYLALTNSNGERGYPELEYKILQ